LGVCVVILTSLLLSSFFFRIVGVVLSAGKVTIDGDVSASLDSTGSFGHVKIPDDGMLSIGNSNDLQIYHNGNHTHIAETGTGNLILRSSAFQVKNAANNETMIQANQGGAVTLFHNNTQRLATQAGGINLTGNITGSGNLQITGNISGSLTSTGSFGLVMAGGTAITADDTSWSDGTATTISGSITSTGSFGMIKKDGLDIREHFSRNLAEAFELDSNGDFQPSPMNKYIVDTKWDLDDNGDLQMRERELWTLFPDDYFSD